MHDGHVTSTMLDGGGTGEMKEDSQKIISQEEASPSSLDCAALDVCCGDAMDDCEAVAGATLAGAIRDAAADATSASLRSPILGDEGAGEMKEGSQKIISQGEALPSSLDCATIDVCCGDTINDCEAVAGATLAGAIRELSILQMSIAPPKGSGNISISISNGIKHANDMFTSLSVASADFTDAAKICERNAFTAPVFVRISCIF